MLVKILFSPFDVIFSLSIQEFLEQPDNALCLSGIDDQFSSFITVISQEPLGTHLMPSSTLFRQTLL